MSIESERFVTFGRVAGIVEDEASRRDRISVFLEVRGIYPLDGFSVPVSAFGKVMLERGMEFLVEIRRGVTEEGDLRPRIIQ